jgi:PAS domain S-box-containing protein
MLQSTTEYSIISESLDGTILLWTDGARRMYGYEPVEVIGTANSSILHVPEDVRTGRHREITQAAKRDGRWEGTMPHLRKNGQRFTARVAITLRRDASGNAVGFLLISKDVTDEVRPTGHLKGTEVDTRPLIESTIDAHGKLQGVVAAERDIALQEKLEEQLRESRAYNRALIEASAHALFTVALDGIIADVNEAATRLTDCSRAQLIDSRFCEYFTDAEQARAGVRKILAESRVLGYELVVITRRGRRITVSLDAGVFSDASGAPVGFLATARRCRPRRWKPGAPR